MKNYENVNKEANCSDCVKFEAKKVITTTDNYVDYSNLADKEKNIM